MKTLGIVLLVAIVALLVSVYYEVKHSPDDVL